MESFGDIYSFIPLQYFCFGEDSDFNKKILSDLMWSYAEENEYDQL